MWETWKQIETSGASCMATYYVPHFWKRHLCLKQITTLIICIVMGNSLVLSDWMFYIRIYNMEDNIHDKYHGIPCVMEPVILKHRIIQKCVILLSLLLIETQHLTDLPFYLCIIISFGSEDVEILLASSSLE